MEEHVTYGHFECIRKV